ncbi:MobV family relaxase [Weissella viridescens]|uniref:MobV family relaxase n=1 Tax=Weissella viridescens TaxID=1629 RepID=UPI003AF246D0
MASTISWHFEKHTKTEVNGLQIHNERKAEKHKNERIDPERSHLNASSVIDEEFGDIPYTQRIEQILDERYTGKRNPRKDAIFDVQHTLQFGGEEILNLPPKEKQAVMITATNFLVEQLGGYQNVLGLNIHRDESNDHVHLDTIPLTDDGRLSAKDIYNRTFMKETQSALLTHLQETYPGLDFVRASETARGFENGRSQADFERLKAEQDQLKHLEIQHEQKLAELQHETKEQLVETLAEINPEYTVSEELYYQKMPVMFDHDGTKVWQFEMEYGDSPKPIKTDFGRSQVMDWLNLDTIQNAIHEALRLAQQLATNIKKRLKEALDLENRLSEKEDRLNKQEEALTDKKLDIYATIFDEVCNRDSVPEERQETIKQAKEVYQDSFVRKAKNARLGLKPDKFFDIESPESVILGWIQDEIKAPNATLADIAIKFGVHESWRQTMIDKGGRIGKTSDGRVLNEPFETLLPKLINKASVQQLNTYMDWYKQQQRDRGFNGPSR